MKRVLLGFCVSVVSIIILANGVIFADPVDFSNLNVEIGKVRLPKTIVHADKEFNKGIYWVTLTAKEGVPYFNISNAKKEMLFDELAIVKTLKSTSHGKKPKIRMGLVKNREYFRIRVDTNGTSIMGYFLVKKPVIAPKEELKPEVPQEEEKSGE